MLSEQLGWRLRLRHVLEAIAECRAFAAGMSYEAFCADARTLKAVVWNIATIGEAVRHIPANVLAAHPAIPWAEMRGMRNQIVHGYDRIDPEIVWNVVQVELPPLVPLLERIIDEGA
jgi:uncharacterized protein with HEPN domain